jgi:hypothetical protein
MKTLSMLTVTLVACLSFSGAMAEVRSAAVAYKDGSDNLTGYLYWNDAVKGKRPGVLVVHEWWGLNDYAKSRAEQLAELGYVAFAVDMYGGDKVTSHPAQAGEWMKATVSNLDGWRRRAQKGLEKLSSLATPIPAPISMLWSVSTGPCPCRTTVKRETSRGAC